MATEHTDRAEPRSFAPNGLADEAGLSRSAQGFFQPIDRAIANSGDLPWALDFGTGANLYQSAAYTGGRLSASVFMTDEVEQKTDAPKIQPPSDAVARPSVIRTKEDAALWDAMQTKSDKESATHIGLSDQIITEMKAKGQASKLEFFDSKPENGTRKAFELPASQAVLKMPPVAESVKNAADASPVALNIQITNVPEVSQAVDPKQWLQQVDATFTAGAQAVRPIEHWLATPNAVNDSLIGIGPALDSAVNYYANTPADQVVGDVQTVLGQTGDVLDRTFSFPHTPDERAKTAGTIMPMFFLEGNVKEPIHPETVQQLGLEGMTETELSALGIRRLAQDATDLHMPEVPEHLKHLELQPASAELLNAIRNKGREFHFAEPGSEEYRYLLAQRVEASTGRTDMMHILMKENPTKIAALEEFLHGTQKKIGLIDKVGEEIAEVRVKDFMLRHPRMLGLTDNDLTVLETLRQQEANYALRRGFSPRMFEVGGHE